MPADQPVESPYDLTELEQQRREQETPIASAPAETPAPASTPPTPTAPESSTQQTRREDGTFGHKHPAFLIEAANEFGFDEQEIANTPTDVLSRQVNRLYRGRDQARAEYSRHQTLSDAAVTRPPEPEPEAPFLPQEVLEALEPSMATFLRQQHKKIQDLEKKLAGSEQREQQRVQHEQDRMLDDFFAGLGDKYTSQFGEGSIHDLADPGQRARRFSVVREATAAKEGTLKKRLTAAVKLLFGDGGAQPASVYAAGAAGNQPAATPAPPPANRSGPTQEEWDRAALARPTQRTESELPLGEERAVRNLRKKMDESERANENGTPEKEGLLG